VPFTGALSQGIGIEQKSPLDSPEAIVHRPWKTQKGRGISSKEVRGECR